MKTLLSNTWMPSGNVLALAKGKGMPIKDWLYHLLPEFRLYWIDAKKKKDSWDATFWNHAKREWDKVDKSRMYREAVPVSKPETRRSEPEPIVKQVSQEERTKLADKWLSQLNR